MSVADLYRNRGVNPLAIQTGGLFRLQPDSNTYGLWWCNEGMGSTLLDKVATPHPGTITTPAWSLDGPWGVGLNDAAGTLYALFGNYGNPTTGSLTVEMVIDAYGMDITGSAYGITLMQKGGWGATGWFLGIRDSADAPTAGKILWITHNETEVTSVSTTIIKNLHACYVAGVLDRATGKQRLFINGVQEGTDLTVSATSITTAATMQCAAYGSGSPATKYKGKIYTMRVSLVARTATEILTNAKLMGFAA